jgi:hypothetical protein
MLCWLIKQLSLQWMCSNSCAAVVPLLMPTTRCTNHQRRTCRACTTCWSPSSRARRWRVRRTEGT